MTVKIPKVKNIYVKGEYIKLDALLKYAYIASSGGEAKHLIKNGEVYVGGTQCMQRGKKIYAGDIVRYGDNTLIIRNAQ